MSALMVHAMALGALQDIAQPVRCPDVPMIEKLGKAGGGESEPGARGVQAEQREDDQGREQPVHEDLDRMLVEAGQHLDAGRAVMKLMEPAPEKRDLMARAVPPVVDEGDRDIAE